MAKRVVAHKAPDIHSTITPKILGELVKARRTSAGLKQEDAASLCGVATGTFKKIELGRGDVMLDKTFQVLQMLGIKLKSFDLENGDVV